MITHGILVTYGTFDNLIHEMNEITANDARRENKKETKVYDNFNRERSQNLAIYRERWR